MPVSPNAIPSTGPVSMDMLYAEFGLQKNLNAYKGLRMYNTADNSRRDIGTGPNAYVSMSDFRGYQATSPVVAGSRAYLTTQTDTLPLFNVMTITVWGGGGGGGGGAVTNSVWNKAATGGGGNSGGSSSVIYSSTTLANAGGGGGGGGGQIGSNAGNGANGTGADGVHGAGGGGGYGYNGGPGGDARSGGSGGNGGKSVIVYNVDVNNSYLNYQNKTVTINIAAVSSGVGTGGSGGSISYSIYEQHGGGGTNGDPGYAIISWT